MVIVRRRKANKIGSLRREGRDEQYLEPEISDLAMSRGEVFGEYEKDKERDSSGPKSERDRCSHVNRVYVTAAVIAAIAAYVRFF
ncbi:hypothetical protein Tcan_05539 [Toxocara canis]|uniref:Uncharacterized protein n=1 Tax=Toxocara canis TaxID=6265 RepID=A0A0B2V9W2_TOXCA|nr:hypothetical protein Tcan_05539 [Toxocara canis]